MNIGDQIKKLRRDLNMTQTEFAKRIGSVQNTITGYESGRRNPSAPVIALICKEFDVREEWLRTGEGEMFNPKPSDVLDQLAYKYQFSNADYVLVEKYVSLSPNKRKELVENVFGFLHEIETALSDTDPHALAYTGTEPPRPMDIIMESIKNLQNENAAPEMPVKQAEAEYIKSRSASARKMGSSASNFTGGDDKEAVNR